MTEPTLSLAGAAAGFHGTTIPARCLEDVSTALRRGAPVLRHAGTSDIEWADTPGKHPGAQPPSAGWQGAPIYFSFSNLGDVGMWLSPDMGLFIDTANGKYEEGVIGVQSFAQREEQLGGKYLGWSSEISGYDLLPFAVPPAEPTSTAPVSGPAWGFNPPDRATQMSIQLSLYHRGRYHGPINGIWGVESIAGIQESCHIFGSYNGPINGVPGPNTCRAIQLYAKRFGGYTGPINSILGPNGWAGFARGVKA
jgi:hypothetical protein